MESTYHFEDDLKEILTGIKTYYPRFSKTDAERITKAFWFAHDAHKDQKRFSDEPYFVHPVGATKILLSINPDIETVMTCLLHDVIEDTPITEEDIEREFGAEILKLCDSVTHISKVQLQLEHSERVFHNIQKLFIAVAKDIRVIFVKLADRIHNLSTLEYVRPEKQKRIAKESLQIYAPVADKLGLFGFKVRIEDLCLKHIDPAMYEQLSQDLAAYRKESEKRVELSRKELLQVFHREKFQIVDLQGREKNLYSVYEKMKRKNLTSFREIYDIFGFRVIVESVDECYRALGILHSHWKPMPKRFKDYISVPKMNGYQSLHTTILGLGKSELPTEIQIKTRQMHIDAEFGPAAHWAYKKNKGSNFDQDYVIRTSWIPQNIPLENQEDPQKFFEEISNSILSERIYVFTPQGDIKTLPAESTPVDFAYAVHSEIGNTCIGATVNGIIKPLDYKLHNGDIVKIHTKSGRKPNPEWIKFVKSSHARDHIQHVINRIKKDRYDHTPNTPEEILPKNQPIPRKRLPPQKNKDEPIVIIGNQSNIPYKIAPCCTPTPGHNIVAYKSRGLHFTIHRSDCKQLEHLDPERFIEASFRIENKIEILAHERIGLLRDYSIIMASHSVNVLDIKITLTPKENYILSNCLFTVQTRSKKELIPLFEDLEKVPNVFSVKTL